MTELLMLRHAQTASNLAHRYLGVTDEPLCAQGIEQAKHLILKQKKKVFLSPLSRCIQTASLLFPQAEQIPVDGLRECDFGEFEGKNYLELSSDSRYQSWINSGGELPFPGGESRCGKSRRPLLPTEER